MSETLTLDNLIAGDFPLVTDEITVVSGQNLGRGSVLGKITSGGKMTLCDILASDGSEAPVSILSQSVDASAGDVANSTTYLCGEFNENELVMGATTTAAQLKDALRALNIYLKPSTVQ